MEKLILEIEKQAYKIIEQLNIIKAWEKIGAKVNLVGSLKMGLLVKHKDIDFHIYTKELKPELAFSVIAELAKNPRVKRVEYSNLAEAEDCCLEFHLWAEDDNKELWQFDLINIKAGSKYDGHFEKIADKIIQQMTTEQKQIIWKLKYQTPDTEKIAGIEYYKAVIQDKIKTFDELKKWRETHKFSGIIEW